MFFIRGDPISVVFVDGLAHEFKIPRIMNTVSWLSPTLLLQLFLNYFQSLGVLL